jgi:hypothetical protein
MNEETAKKRIRFIDVNRSYIINYNYGMELVKIMWRQPVLMPLTLQKDGRFWKASE